MEQINRFLRKLVCFPIHIYHYGISPFLQPRCRFYPSCSCYAVDAIMHHGVLRGLQLSCWRLLRCQPFARSGYDPVLPNKRDL